jgi:hypothetical protein
MKKFAFLIVFATAVILLSNCGPSQKTTATTTTTTTTTTTAPKLTYESNLQTVIAGKCSPCHFPAKGGNKKAFDNYTNVKTDIDEMIRRIELNPTDKGFMPFRGAKLSDTTINLFKQWRSDGALER